MPFNEDTELPNADEIPHENCHYAKAIGWLLMA